MSGTLQNSNSNGDGCGKIITFRAIHSYKGNLSKCQLSFQKGDIIVCNAAHVSENDPASGGWLWGSIENSACVPSSTTQPAVGWFPPKFVQRLSSPVVSITTPPVAAAEVDDPFAGLPLLTNTFAETNTSAALQTVEEKRTQEEKLISSPAIIEMKNETIISDTDEVQSLQLLSQLTDEPTRPDTFAQHQDEFGDFDGGIQPENTIELQNKESGTASDDTVTSKGVLELPSPETLVAFVVDTNDIANGGLTDPPSLPFTGDTAALPADSDQDIYQSAIRFSDELNLTVPTDQQQSDSKLSHSQEHNIVTESDRLTLQQPTTTTLPEESISIDGTFGTSTTNFSTNFDKNTTLEGSGKITPLELPSPEKLGILIHRLDIKSFDKGITPDIPYLHHDETLVDEPIDTLTVDGTSLKYDETIETDTKEKPTLSPKNQNRKFIRVDSSISKLESFHSVRESIGTAAEDSSQEKNDNELGKLEEDNPIITSPPGQFFDAIQDEEELNGTGQTHELYYDYEKSRISDDTREGQQNDEDEFGDFNGNLSPAKQQLSVATSDDFGSFDGGCFSSPTSGNLNDGTSVSNGNKSHDFPVILDALSVPPLSVHRSSDLGDYHHDSSSISLTSNFKPDQKVILDNDISDKSGGVLPDVESATDAGIFVASEAPLLVQGQDEDILLYTSVDEKISSKCSSSDIDEKDGDAEIEGFSSTFRRNSDSIKVDEDLNGRSSGTFFDGDGRPENNDGFDRSDQGQTIDKISTNDLLELPSPEKLGIYVEAAGALLVESLHLPFSVVPDGSLTNTELKFDEVQSVNDANGEINERVNDVDSDSGSSNNQACNFQSPEELGLFIETTAARLKDTLSENVSFRQTDAGIQFEFNDKSSSGYVSDDGFGEFSDGLALASSNAEYDSTDLRPSTFKSGDVLINHHDNINVERFQGPSDPDAVEGRCMKTVEEQPEDFGDFLENFNEMKLLNGDTNHPVSAKEATEGKSDFILSTISTETDDVEFAAFPETETSIDDAHSNDLDTSPNDCCVLPQFQSVNKVQEPSGDLNHYSLEFLESSAEIQAFSNQRLDEGVNQEFDEFGDFGSASLQQLKTDDCTVKPDIDDVEFGDFADFDETKQVMPQGETALYASPDTKSNFDESDFGDFMQTQETPDGNDLNQDDHEWITAAQEVIESIFPMPDCTFSYPTEDYRPPSISDVLELESDKDNSRPDPNTLWSERSLQQCFQRINQRPDTPSRIICVPFTPKSFFPIAEEKDTREGYRQLEESLSLEPAYTF